MSLLKKNIFPVILFLLPVIGFNQTTWNQDIATILFNNCTSCHHDGAIAPFSLMSYDEAVDHGFDIKNSIIDGIMPPWPPDETYVHFKDELVLSEDEKNKIIDWAEDGFMEGTGSPPSSPVYTDESMLDDIDEVIYLPEYTVSKDQDEFRKFVVQTYYYESKFLQAIEFLPGNGSIIHHMTLHLDSSDVSWGYDMSDPEPGYNGDGTIMETSLKLIGGWVPGGTMGQFPPGMAIEIPPGADLVIEIHYAPNNLGESAAPVLHFQWSDDPSPRMVKIDRFLDYFQPCLQEEELYIPANTVQTFHQIYEEGFNNDISLISITPHMHYLGATYLVYATSSYGITIPLIDVADWDFHWQGTYTFQSLIHLPDSAILYGIADYDNTIENEDNPSDPPVDVYAGGHTTDEMMSCYFTYVNYQPGDEYIVLDSSVFASPVFDQSQQLNFTIFPNPANHFLHILNQTNSNEVVVVEITNTEGRVILQTLLGPSIEQYLNIEHLPPGVYYIMISNGRNLFVEKFIKI